jgi:hypothetical protein
MPWRLGIALDRDGPTPTEPSSLVSVTAVSVMSLTPSGSPGINSNAARSYLHALSLTGRRTCDCLCANESKCNQCSRNQLQNDAGSD